ncbi:MAG: carboxypeptidase regulatory-like domain-containing protein [Candidatus Omnitrophota bacterium]
MYTLTRNKRMILGAGVFLLLLSAVPAMAVEGEWERKLEETQVIDGGGGGFIGLGRGIPQTIITSTIDINPIIVKDVDLDGREEIAFTGTPSNSGLGNNPSVNLYLLDSNGDNYIPPDAPYGTVSKWPIEKKGGGIVPALHDINNDNISEVIVTGVDNQGIRIYAYTPEGNILSKYPKLIPGTAYCTTYGTSVVADIDLDERPDLVITGSSARGGNKVYAVNFETGNSLEGWEGGRPLPIGEELASNISPVIADMDGDKYPEIIIGTFTHGGKGTNTPKLHILSHDGKLTTITEGLELSKKLKTDLNIKDGDRFFEKSANSFGFMTSPAVMDVNGKKFIAAVATYIKPIDKNEREIGSILYILDEKGYCYPGELVNFDTYFYPTPYAYPSVTIGEVTKEKRPYIVITCNGKISMFYDFGGKIGDDIPAHPIGGGHFAAVLGSDNKIATLTFNGYVACYDAVTGLMENNFPKKMAVDTPRSNGLPYLALLRNMDSRSDVIIAPSYGNSSTPSGVVYAFKTSASGGLLGFGSGMKEDNRQWPMINLNPVNTRYESAGSSGMDIMLTPPPPVKEPIDISGKVKANTPYYKGHEFHLEGIIVRAAGYYDDSIKHETTTAADGSYKFEGLETTDYTVVANPEGKYGYKSESRAPVGNDNNVNFSLSPKEGFFVLYGQVVDAKSREGIDGVTVDTTVKGGSYSAVTADEGYYLISEIPRGEDTYAVNASKDGYVGKTQSMPGQIMQDFNSMEFKILEDKTYTYTITGITYDSNNNTLSGVTIGLEGKSVTATTQTDGSYSLSVELANGDYYITAKKNYYVNTTGKQHIVIADDSYTTITAVNFNFASETVKVSGYVKEKDSNTPLKNALITATITLNGRTDTKQTYSSFQAKTLGYYEFSSIPKGANIRVVAGLDGYNASDPLNVGVVENKKLQDIFLEKGKYIVSGKVCKEENNEGIASAAITIYVVKDNKRSKFDSLRSGSGGAYSVKLPAGDYIFNVSAPKNLKPERAPIEKTVTSPGNGSLTLDLKLKEVEPEVLYDSQGRRLYTTNGDVYYYYYDSKGRKIRKKHSYFTVKFINQTTKEVYKADIKSSNYYSILAPEGKYDIKINDHWQRSKDKKAWPSVITVNKDRKGRMDWYLEVPKTE